MLDSRSGNEKRKFRRIPAAFGVVYSVKEPFEIRSDFGEKDRNGLASDLSAGGLSLYSDFFLPVGTVISVKFRLANGPGSTPDECSQKMDLVAQVHHTSLIKAKATFIAGVKFMRLSEKDQTFIAACAELSR